GVARRAGHDLALGPIRAGEMPDGRDGDLLDDLAVALLAAERAALARNLHVVGVLRPAVGEVDHVVLAVVVDGLRGPDIRLLRLGDDPGGRLVAAGESHAGGKDEKSVSQHRQAESSGLEGGAYCPRSLHPARRAWHRDTGIP